MKLEVNQFLSHASSPTEILNEIMIIWLFLNDLLRNVRTSSEFNDFYFQFYKNEKLNNNYLLKFTNSNSNFQIAIDRDASVCFYKNELLYRVGHLQ